MYNDTKWSPSEKKIARRAYDTARAAVLAKALSEFKAKASAVATIDDMWAIGDCLREKGRDLDQMLDYRYSQLPLVFARLIREEYLDEKSLAGLAEDKLEDIRRVLRAFAKDRV